MATAPAPDAPAPAFIGSLEMPTLASLLNNSQPPPPSDAPVVSVNVLGAQVPVATGEPSVGDVVMALEEDPRLYRFCEDAYDAKTESDFSHLNSPERGADVLVMEVDEPVLETPPHLVPVLEIQFQIQAIAIGDYKPFLPGSNINSYGQNITILPGNEHCMARGPAYFKWTIGRLLSTTMVENIKNRASDEAPVLEKYVRGIRPRVGAQANPREGEPTEYVLVLADIIKAMDPEKAGKDANRSARNKYEKDQLKKYKSACLCNLENPTNTLVSVFELCAMCIDITLH